MLCGNGGGKNGKKGISNIYTYEVLVHRLRDYHQQQQQRCIMPFSQKNSKHLRQQEQEQQQQDM